ncbi:TetR/AcrR family transcriptional regulator [Kitasatospora sp. NBC_00374]|uniref:ScbR family autoregulator-binding transcription factor n=1 Tax=Kitasatospora sp. NBC_00374 TaxID=2975964 RepID=UPI00325258A2
MTSSVPAWENPKSGPPRSPELVQDRAVRTRAQVLLAAARHFAGSGFRGASVKDVADEAGVTKGAVYFHFVNKEALAIAVVEEHYARWPALLNELQAEDLSPLDTAVEMLNRAALAFRDDIVVQAGARLQIERSLIDAPLPTPYQGWTDLLSDLLTKARDEGQLRPGVDPHAAARVLVSGFFGAQHISETLHHRADLLDRWNEMRDLLTSAIRA